MKTAPLVLNEDTLMSDVNKFFEGLSPDKRVRARKNDDGLIELYVRKNSFKQFFTDKLKLDFLVKRDYLEAKEHIFKILNQSGLDVEKFPSLSYVTNGLNYHNHDFVAEQFNSNKSSFLYFAPGISDAKKLLNENWNAVNVDSLPKQLISGPGGQKEISKIIGLLENPEDQEILKRNFNALNNIMFSDDSSKSNPTIIDCHHAIDFSRAWQNAMSELTGKTSSDNTGQTADISFNKDSSLINVLTDFSKRITAWSKLENTDFKAGYIGNSNADLIIIDPAFSPGFHNDVTAKRSGKPLDTASEDNPSIYTLKNYTDFKLLDSEEKADAVQITYEINSQFDRAEIDNLYENIGKIIYKKMNEKPKSAANEIYVVHLPILKLDTKEGISADNKMAYKAFLDAKEKWTTAHPNLRIKVEWPETINRQEMEFNMISESRKAHHQAWQDELRNNQM